MLGAKRPRHPVTFMLCIAYSFIIETHARAKIQPRLYEALSEIGALTAARKKR